MGDIDLLSSTNVVKGKRIKSCILIGDVKDRDCVIVDDMVDTAGTLCKAADALKQIWCSSKWFAMRNSPCFIR